MASRIALVHATPLALTPINAAFARLWPQAQCIHRLDENLPGDLETSGLDAAMHQRFVGFAKWANSEGAQAILFTCSAFGAAIESAKRAVALPMLKPNEAMFDEALKHCAALGGPRRIGLATTFAPAAHSMLAELHDAIAQGKYSVEAQSACAEGAMALKSQGQVAEHDAMVMHAVQALALAGCDVILLGQFSMAHLREPCEQSLGKPVLSSPDSAVRTIKALLSAN